MLTAARAAGYDVLAYANARAKRTRLLDAHLDGAGFVKVDADQIGEREAARANERAE